MARAQTAKQVAFVQNKSKAKTKGVESSKKVAENLTSNKTTAPKIVVDTHDELREGIRALGGNDEDYALLKDVDSEAEAPGPTKSDVRMFLLYIPEDWH